MAHCAGCGGIETAGEALESGQRARGCADPRHRRMHRSGRPPALPRPARKRSSPAGNRLRSGAHRSATGDPAPPTGVRGPCRANALCRCPCRYPCRGGKRQDRRQTRERLAPGRWL